MAAPTAVQGIGQANATGSRSALYLKIFAGEVLDLLDRKLVVMNTTTVQRDLTGAKVASFPTFGDAAANYHVPGDDLVTDNDDQTSPEDYLSNIQVGEHLIYADRVLQSSILLDELEERLSHWDARSRFASKIATAIAEKTEDNLFRKIAAASGMGTDIQGTKISSWDSGTNAVQATPTAAQLYDHIYAAAEDFDERNVASEGRFAAVNPSNFYALLRLTGAVSNKSYEAVHKDYIGGQNGDLAMPNQMGMYIGNIFVMMSNGIPTTAGTTNNSWALNSADSNAYDTADMTKLVRLLVWSRETLGTVRVRSPRMDVNYIPERLAHLVTVSQAMGHGVLRPEAAYTLRETT